MSFSPGFPTRNFFDPPTLAQIVGYAMPWIMLGLKERHKIAAWFGRRCLCIIEMGADGYAQKAMTFSEARDFRNQIVAKKETISFQIIDFQAGLIDRFMFRFTDYRRQYADFDDL
jgi:hypothetical protein